MDTLLSTFRNGCQPSTPDINPPRDRAKPPPNGSRSFIFQKSDLPTYSNIFYIMHHIYLFYIYINFLKLDYNILLSINRNKRMKK